MTPPERGRLRPAVVVLLVVLNLLLWLAILGAAGLGQETLP